MKKTIVSLLLVLCLLVIVVPAMSMEADAAEYTSGYFTYSVNSGCATITGYTGSATSVTIPSSIDGYIVDTIGADAFNGNNKIQYVSFPNTLTTIGNYAFAGCVQLKEVTLPTGLASLGQRSFMNCNSLAKITVKSVALNVPYWGDSSFKGQPFYRAGYLVDDGIQVIFADGVTSVPKNLFYPHSGSAYCPNITSVKFADSVTSIGESAFSYAMHLKTVDFGNGMEVIGEKAFAYCSALTTLDFPATTLKTIGASAFESCTALKSVSLPNSLTTIGNYAFAYCSGFTSITLPKELTSLGQRSFAECKNLTKITVKSIALNDITYWGDSSFQRQPFYNAGTSGAGIAVVFASGVTRVPGFMFHPNSGTGYAPKITSVTLADTVTEIGERAFGNCIYLKKVDLGDGLIATGTAAFEGCTALTSITFPASSLTTISDNAFRGCTALKTVSLPSSLTTIGSSAFENCTVLGNVSLPSSLTTIGNYAFANCNSFTSVTLPKKLTSLGQRSFANCNYLTKITIKSTALNDITWWGDSSFQRQPFYNAGTSASGISVVFASGVTRVPGFLFYPYSGMGYAPKVTSVTLADTVTEIGETGLAGCIYLKSIDLGKGLKIIGNNAFAEDTALTKLQIPATVTEVRRTAFKGCTALKTVRFLNNAPSFGYDVFSGDTTTVYYPRNREWPESAMGNHSGALTWKGFYVAGFKTQPKSAYAKMGKKATITVVAQGEDLTYAWYIKNAGSSSYSKSSVTGDTYTATMSEKSKDRMVFCKVTDKYGVTVKSKTVALREAVSITSQSKTTYTKRNATAKATVKASGDGLKYTWYIKNAGEDSYTKTSATGSTYSCKMNSTTKDRLVYCKVTDKYGKTAKTETVRLRMAATITSQPTTVYAKSGSTAKATVKASGDGLKYTWYVKDAGDDSYTKSSATTSTYSVKMSSATKNRRVYCVVTDKYGKKDTSDTMILRMAATVTTQPKSVTVAKGATAKVTVKAAGDGLKYAWYYKDVGSDSFKKTSTFTGTSYKMEMTKDRSGRQVYCKITDKYGKTVKTNTVTLKMK